MFFQKSYIINLFTYNPFSSVSFASNPVTFQLSKTLIQSTFWFVQNAGAKTNLESHEVAAEVTDERVKGYTYVLCTSF